jgi:hypothetical protein
LCFPPRCARSVFTARSRQHPGGPSLREFLGEFYDILQQRSAGSWRKIWNREYDYPWGCIGTREERIFALQRYVRSRYETEPVQAADYVAVARQYEEPSPSDDVETKRASASPSRPERVRI